MKIYLDAHIPPSLAPWITENYTIETYSFDFMGWRDKLDKEVFMLMKKEPSVIITKDEDFVNLVSKYKSPPKVIWLTCGNTSKSKLKEIFSKLLETTLALLNDNDLVEISD